MTTADWGFPDHREATPPDTLDGGFAPTPDFAIVWSPDSRRLPVQMPSEDIHVAFHNCDYIQIPYSGDATWMLGATSAAS